MSKWVVINGEPSFTNSTLPESSENDIGRRIIRGDFIGSQQYLGWNAIGVVIEYAKMPEIRTDGSFAMDGEIGSKIEDLRKFGISDSWKILYGNRDEERIDVADFIKGLQNYDELKKSKTAQESMSITEDMLHPHSHPALIEVDIRTVKTPKKRGRPRKDQSVSEPKTYNAKKRLKEQAEITEEEKTNQNDTNINEVDDILCVLCLSGDNADNMLLCDYCNGGYHMTCLNPPLVEVPEGNWYCNNCSEQMLTILKCKFCGKVFRQLKRYETHLKSKCKSNNQDMDEAKEVDPELLDENENDKEPDIHVCEYCEKEFKSLGGYQYHMKFVCSTEERREKQRSKHINPNEKIDPEKYFVQIGDESGYQCPHCLKILTTIPGWKYHTSKACGPKAEEDKKIKKEKSISMSQEADAVPARRKRYSVKLEYNEDCGNIEDTENSGDEIDLFGDVDSVVIAGLASKKDFVLSGRVNISNYFVDRLNSEIAESEVSQACDLLTLESWIELLKATGFENRYDVEKLRVPDLNLHVKRDENSIAEVEPFKAMSLGNCDWFLNAGGPVWSLAFNFDATSTQPKGLKDLINQYQSENSLNSALLSTNIIDGSAIVAPTVLKSKYLAVGLSRIGWTLKGDNKFNPFPNKIEDKFDEYDIGVDLDHFMNSADTNPSIIEIWTLESQKETLSLAYIIGFAWRGPAWQLSWCPITFNDDKVAGLLAATFGDGSCLVLALPVWQQVRSELNQIPLLIEGETLLHYELTCKDLRIMCCSWNTYRPSRIACGLSDGSIAVWDLDFKTLLDPLRKVQRPRPVLRLIDRSINPLVPMASAIRSIEFCPYSEDLILTGGYDSNSKIWDVRNPNKPVKISIDNILGWVYDAQWDPLDRRYFSCGADRSTPMCRDLILELRKSNESRVSLYSHNILYAGIWKLLTIIPPKSNSKSLSESPLIVSASSDGSIRCGRIHQLCAKKRPKFKMYQPFRILKVDNDNQINDEHSVNETYHARSVVVDVEMDTECDNQHSTTVMKNISPALPMHTLASCYLLNDSSLPTCVLAYGGALGLVRVHSINNGDMVRAI